MFSSFFILILAFPWLLISYIRFTKWTPAFSLGGSVNQLNGQAEPHVIMAHVLHLFKIQVSLTEQSCLIHIFFVSWIKDFFSPLPAQGCGKGTQLIPAHRISGWRLLAGELGLEGLGGGRAAPRRGWKGPSGFCGCLSCCWHPALLPGQGQRMESCRRRGQLVVCWIYTWQAVLSPLPCAVTFCVWTFPKPEQCHNPCDLRHGLCSRAGVTQVPVRSSIEELLLFLLLQQSWAVPAAGHVIAETSGSKSVCKQINQKSYLNIYWNN